MRCFPLALTLASAALVLVPVTAQEPAVSPSYDRDVQPILRKHCLNCHKGERPRGDLDMSSYAGLMGASASGKPVIPGKPRDSLLYALAAHLEAPKMPPGEARIPQADLEVIRR